MSVALRVDASTGVEERIEHLSGPHGLMYAWTARPPEANSCVVVCSSVLGDFIANYHRERLLGRALAALGHGVVRFHYTGEGNSQGERRDMTFASLCDDARAVLTHAKSSGYSRLAVLGTRMGALVSAAVLSTMPRVPLALWEPVMDPLRFIQEAGRARRMSQLTKEGGGEVRPWRDELEQKGVLDVLGYDLYPAFVDSLGQIDLLALFGSVPRNVFIARFGGRPGAPEPLADTLGERGFQVRSGSFGTQESWWMDKETVSDSTDLVTATASWLDEALRSEK